MKVTYDKEADAMYIYIEEIKKGDIAKTISLNDNIILDLGEDKKILGIEILSASKNMRKNSLETLVKIPVQSK